MKAAEHHVTCLPELQYSWCLRTKGQYTIMMDTIIKLAEIFRANGKQLYMVGGTVRNLLLHRLDTPDADLTTDALPEETRALAAQLHPTAVVLVGERFGTVQLRFRRNPEAPPEDDEIIEITTYRSERYNPESRKPEVCFGTVLEEDLLRRDFTINAMARDPLTGQIIDPFGGREDLHARRIRAVGDDPVSRFSEDPLRMLRAVRFAVQLDFTIEPRTAAAITQQAETLTKISSERIRDEMNKILLSPAPARGLRLLVDLGLMRFIIPEVLELRGVSQRPAHSKDVYEHTLRVVQNAPPRLLTRWAALLHDIAKPRTRSVEDNKVHFFGHEDVGAVMARDILRRLRFSREFIEQVSRLVKLHMRSNSYTSDWTDGAVRRLMLDAEPVLFDLLDLSAADITSYRPERVQRAVARVQELRERCIRLKEEAERVPLKSPLDGNELMTLFNRGPGPWLRPVKEHLLALVIDGKLAPDDKVGAAEEARRFLQENPPDREQPQSPQHSGISESAS
jgi:poly(A) polymerase